MVRPMVGIKPMTSAERMAAAAPTPPHPFGVSPRFNNAVTKGGKSYAVSVADRVTKEANVTEP